MKKVLLILGILLAAAQTYSQGFIDTTKIWHNLIFYYPYAIGTEALQFRGEKVMDEMTYVKVMRSVEEDLGSWSTYGYVREDGDKVYFRKSALDADKLIYDFGVELFDTVSVYHVYNVVYTPYLSSIDYFVSGIDSLLIGDSYQKQIHLNPIAEGSTFAESEQWIESMGSMSGFLHNYNGKTGADAFILLCYSKEETLEYLNPSYSTCWYSFSNGIEQETTALSISIEPNPVSELSVIRVRGGIEGRMYRLEVFDDKGSRIYSTQFSEEYPLSGAVKGPGIYLYRVSGEGNIEGQGKFIVL
ncbi:MAG: hypothetical protein ACOYXB_03420 [Bacteroidota bacterium]